MVRKILAIMGTVFILFTSLLAQDPPVPRMGFRSDIKLAFKNLSIANPGDCLKFQSDKMLAPEACGTGGSSTWGAITGTLSDQTDLSEALSGKAASSHTHAIGDTTNLQTTLDGKAATSHSHAASDVTSGTLDAGRLPNPAASTLGGVKSKTCSGTDKLSAIGTDGLPVCSADQTSAGGGSLNSGDIVLRLSACGTGFTEVGSLSGKFVVGTTAAAGDVGDTGGSDTVTSVLNHTHTVNVTDPGHAHTLQRYPTATGTSSGFTADTSMSGTPAAVTLPMQSQTTGISAATANPAGGVASTDNRPAFMKVIFCSKD